MPGFDERRPSPADRPPASRVGDELQARADEAEEQGRTIDDAEGARIEQEADDAEGARIEQEAHEAAREKMWDQSSTAREGREHRERRERDDRG